MEFLQGPWPFIIVLIAFVLVFIGVNFYVCRQYTGTWNGLKYLFDHKYWCFAILNHEYAEAKKTGVSVQDFITDFARRILIPRKKGTFTKMRESERRLLVTVLSQKKFFTTTFGTERYDMKAHREAWNKWINYQKSRGHDQA